MSFIFGIVDFNKKPVTQEAILALANAVKWENFTAQTELHGNIALGFCSHPGRKPKAGIFKTHELFVLADIRIYNAKELRKFVDYTTAEEAVAKAYLKWGPQCANHINGDFAAVVVDRKKNEVHLFRDYIGVRTLAYCISENRLIFASHEFGLAQSGLVKAGLSEKKLVCTLFRFKIPYSQTVFQQILKVVPGYCVSCSPGQKHLTKYWKPENIRKDKTLSFDDAVSRLRNLLISATVNRMEPGKTGMHVSGGIDSTGIASIVADHQQDRSQTIGYSWTPEVFDDPVEGVNEKEFIDAFCEDKKVPVKYLSLEVYETVKDAVIPEFATQHIEHPVMKMAAKESVQTLFSGWGGDEFVSLSLRGTFNHLFFSLKWVSLLRFIAKTGIKSSIFKLRTDVFPFLIPFGLLHVYKAQYTNWSNLCLLKPAFILKNWKPILFHNRKGMFGYGNRTRFMLNLLENYHIPERLDSWTINGERYGFEYKYPLLDKDVLEFWFSIPIEYTYKDYQSRLLYREAMKGILTEKIRTRKDKGEALRIASSCKEQLEGKKYLAELFYALPEQDHLPFFRLRALNKVINMPPSKVRIKNWMEISKLTCYLRYVALVKKYLPRMNYSRQLLHDRHRLSHQQIDRLLGENRSGEFLHEKLARLEAVRRFLQVTDKLRESHIPFICLKGPLLSFRIYDDPTVRISHDIDLLIDIENLEHALKVLKEQGYQFTPGVVWPQKKFKQELLTNVTHHVSLWHRQLNLCVELHWTLTYKLPLSQKKIKEITQQNLIPTNFAGRTFTVLNPELELLYLIIHGARHGWNRLKWLADIRDYPLDGISKERFCLLAERLKAERLIRQTNSVLESYYGDQRQLPDPWKKQVPNRMIRYVRQSIDQPAIRIEQSVREIMRSFRYSWYLFPGIRYKIQWLSTIFIRGGDLADHDLSSKTAYYLYRPWSFIKRRVWHV